MLRYRLIFGPLMIAAVVLVFYLDNQLDRVQLTGFARTLFLGRDHPPAGLIMLILLLLLIAGGVIEMCRIIRSKGVPVDPLIVGVSSMGACVLLFAVPYWLNSQSTLAIAATYLSAVLMIALLRFSWRARRTDGAMAVGAATVFAVIYMGLMPGFFVAIRRWHDAWIILAIILTTKACDIGAYFTGRAIGRHKLIPWLSPGKTWEGLAGGVALASLAATAMVYLIQQAGLSYRWVDGNALVVRQYHFDLWWAAAAGALLGVIGQLGDLCASLFKRDAGIKDSGASVPGFGGLLDVVDSPILTAPVAYWLLALAATAAT